MSAVVVVFLALFGISAGAVTVATVTGQQERLCTAIGGTWTPAPHGTNVCPGSSLVKTLKGRE